MEVELKLLVAREDLDRVLRSEAVKRCALGRARSAELESVYYDTPRFDLYREHLALRLRRTGRDAAGSWLQTLKGDAASAAGLTEREEYEWKVAARRIDFARLAATPSGPLFAKRRVREALHPVFTTHFSRHTQRLTLPGGSQAELCVDSGEIRAGTRRSPTRRAPRTASRSAPWSAPICEIEIELKDGSPLALFEFAAELLREVPFRLGALSKAERGYALVRKAKSQPPLRPQRSHAIALRADMSPTEMLQTIARRCLAQIHANEDGFLAGRDPEFLHALRVGLRRLRVALAMIADPLWREALEPLREEMRWLFSLLGPVRNWDVFMTETLPPLVKHFGAETDWTALRARGLRLRRRHLALARDAIEGPRYAALLLSMGRLLYGRLPAQIIDTDSVRTHSRNFARAIIERRERTLRRHAENFTAVGAEQRHRMRITAKKLRYCAEFFESLYPHKKVRRYVDALAALQDALGTANDAAVGAALIVELGAGDRIDARAIGVARGWVAASEARAIVLLPQAWKEFAACKPFWD